MSTIADVAVIRTFEVSTQAFEINRFQCCTNGVLVDTDHGSIYYSFTGKVDAIPALCAVDQYTAYTWHKRCTKSSWLYKWPMKSQNLGRKTKRFFVLSDNVLCYYDTEEEAKSGTGEPRYKIELNENTTLKIGTHFKTHCISLKTHPNVLWFTAKTPDLEAEWYQELQSAISRFSNRNVLYTCMKDDLASCQSASLPNGATDEFTVTESVWSPIKPGFNILAVDGVSQRKLHSHSRTHKSHDVCSKMIIKAALFGKPGDYLLEYTTCEHLTVHHPLTGIPRRVQLSLIKLMGSCIILCGNCGWISIFDAVTTNHIIPQQSSHYKESKILSVACVEVESSSAVTAGVEQDPEEFYLIGTGDRLGGLGLWLYSTCSRQLQLKSFTDVHEAVSSIGFVAQTRHTDGLPTVASNGAAKDPSHIAAIAESMQLLTLSTSSLPLLVIGSEGRCSLIKIQDAAQTHQTVDYPWTTAYCSLLDSIACEQDSAFYMLRESNWGPTEAAAAALNEPRNVELQVDRVLTAASGSSQLCCLRINLQLPGS